MTHVLPKVIDINSTFIGTPQPLNNHSPRIKYPLSENETISIADRIFKNTVKTSTAAETADAKNPEKLIKKYEEMVDDHIERRVAIIFQQLVVCYKTGLHFEIGDTRHQGESAKALQLIDHTNTKSKLCTRNAAHSSTLPCIIAYDRVKWDTHIKDNTPAPQGFIYINGADIYRGANSTLAMPRDINEADIAIDGTTHSDSLRSKTITLFNECAAGKTDPITAFKTFLATIQEETNAKIDTVNKPGIKTALKRFKIALEDTENNTNEDEFFFEKMLGIQVDDNHDTALARKVLCELRYKAIRDNQYAQSQIISKIEGLTKAVFTALGKTRTPPYLKRAVLNVLNNELDTKKDKTRLDKLFNSPQGQYFRNVPQRQKRLETTTNLVKEKALILISAHAKELHITFRNLKRDEILKRGLTTRVLRQEISWTQSSLARRIKALFPYTAASQATLSRIENNIKLIDSSYATQLATVFKVDPALFIPSFFND